MERFRYIILGAGPSGLAFAHTILQAGEESFLVLEQEDIAGGLCRSTIVDGYPLDIGGGHFLDLNRGDVLELLFRFLPSNEWRRFDRISRIRLRGREIDYPLEANLWQFPVDEQVEFLESIAQAGTVRNIPMPGSFEEWIRWKVGERIANEYMLPYNRKIWSVDLSKLGTYWLYKLPDVSFRQTLLSCLHRKPFGSIPAHASFLYPKRHGYGEVWKRMGEALGDRLRVSTPVESVDVERRIVNGCLSADRIITSVPWTLWTNYPGIPEEILKKIARLSYTSIDIEYRTETLSTDAHWIYDPDERVPHHRVLCRNLFLEGSQGHWTETNALRSGSQCDFRYRNEYAYPLNTTGKPEDIDGILRWAEGKCIHGIGRWGTWEHMNSDVAVSGGISAARTLLKKRASQE